MASAGSVEGLAKQAELLTRPGAFLGASILGASPRAVERAVAKIAAAAQLLHEAAAVLPRQGKGQSDS